MENPDQTPYQPQPQPLPPPAPQPVQPLYPQSEQQQAPSPQTDPGKTLGIVGFVLAFVGLQLVGLILSIIGFNKSKKAGFKNTLAVVGIVLNSIFLVIGTMLALFFIVTTISYSGISNRADTASSKTSAATVIKWSNVYYTDNGVYPTTFSQVENVSGITNSPILFDPNDPKTIEFYNCGALGVKVGYYDYDAGDKAYLYAGEADSSTTCTFSAS